MKQTNRKGFTLAELLIVVAIIAVLVAIAIPVFTTQKYKAELAVDQANIRSYYAELQTDYLLTRKIDTTKLHEPNGTMEDGLTDLILSGSNVTLKVGTYWVRPSRDDSGYQIMYFSKKGNVLVVYPNK